MLVIFFDGITKINVYVIFIKTSTVGGRGTAEDNGWFYIYSDK